MTAPCSVCVCTPEAVPYVKTGGLADVSGTLPRALSDLGCDVRIVLPGYRAIDRAAFHFRPIGGGEIPLGASHTEVRWLESRLPGTAIPVYLVEEDAAFDRPGLYGDGDVDYPDNLRRFTVFGRGALALLRHLGWGPDVLHCQDWQTALLPVWLRVEPRDRVLAGTATLLTIHNLAYQGVFPRDALPVTGLPWEFFTPGGIEFFGLVNLLKGGLICADLLSTVSEQYAREIQTEEFGCGLDGVVRNRARDLVGILNGVDYSVWDPSHDAFIPARYTREDLAGKTVCKTHLQRTRGLRVDPDAPLLGVISRLVDQKGLDLVAAVADALLGLGAQLSVLGLGDPRYHALFEELHQRHPDRAAFRLGYDDALAHQIEAGADIYLMPSRFEPSGLSQLYSLRYGTVPVVRRTGGLADTIVDATPDAVARDAANGFVFDAYTPDAFLDAAKRAIFAWREPPLWRRLQSVGMGQDFSWGRAAARYLDAYQRAIAARRAAVH
ncbi:MAG TPA: glycogen synthase GlgA [bacterium]|nr:glycogen synthase GlgA [bacterium]